MKNRALEERKKPIKKKTRTPPLRVKRGKEMIGPKVRGTKTSSLPQYYKKRHGLVLSVHGRTLYYEAGRGKGVILGEDG